MTLPTSVTLELPPWLNKRIASAPLLQSSDARMRYAVDLLSEHIETGTGGPFVALVVEENSGRLISAGVNLVTKCHDPSAHAEIVAVRFAAAARGSYQLGGMSAPKLQLVTTGQPCAMCYGMVVWSGIQSLLIGASVADAEELAGFDEGPLHPSWREELTRRGIAVTEGVFAEEVKALYRRYVELGGIAYNGERCT